MAGDWIKWMKGLVRRREVVAVAQELGLDRRIVACACMEFWEWADENTTTGFIERLTTDNIDSLVGISGFSSALAASGWLDVRNDGIQIPRWERYNGQSAKKRALASIRQSRRRHAGVTPASRKKRDASSLLFSTPVSAQAETKESTNDEKSSTEILRDQCAQLYAAYPRHVAKQDALKAIAKALHKTTFAALLEAVTEYAQARVGDDSQFTPYPATWFNEERWNDDRTQWKCHARNGHSDRWRTGAGQRFDPSNGNGSDHL